MILVKNYLGKIFLISGGITEIKVTADKEKYSLSLDHKQGDSSNKIILYATNVIGEDLKCGEKLEEFIEGFKKKQKFFDFSK
jgi:hypothetical protein